MQEDAGRVKLVYWTWNPTHFGRVTGPWRVGNGPCEVSLDTPPTSRHIKIPKLHETDTAGITTTQHFHRLSHCPCKISELVYQLSVDEGNRRREGDNS